MSHGRIFGGQIIAQGLHAAAQSVDGKPAHSLHAYFSGPGSCAAPVDYIVSRDHDGRSFSRRTVTAVQNGSRLVRLSASFHAPEPGFHHQLDAPDAPDPESLPSNTRFGPASPIADSNLIFDTGGIEVRPVDMAQESKQADAAATRAWFRFAGPLPQDRAIHQAIMAFVSDMTLLSTALKPHGIAVRTAGLRFVSLDHAVWFHDEFRADEWLLYAKDSPWAGGARGFTRGQVFTRQGRLVASVAQEGLFRS